MLSAQLSSASWASAHQQETNLTGKYTSLQSWATPRLPARWMTWDLASLPPVGLLPSAISHLHPPFPSLPPSLYFCPFPPTYIFLLLSTFPAFSLSLSSFALYIPPFLYCHSFSSLLISSSLPVCLFLSFCCPVCLSLSPFLGCPLAPHLSHP